MTVWSPGVCEVPCREVKRAKQEQRSWFSKWMQYLLIVLRFNRIILIFFFLRLDRVVFLSPTYNTFPRLEMFTEKEVKPDVKSKPLSSLEKSLLPQEVAQAIFSSGLLSPIPGCWRGGKHVSGSCPVIGSSSIRIKPYLSFPLNRA